MSRVQAYLSEAVIQRLDALAGERRWSRSQAAGWLIECALAAEPSLLLDPTPAAPKPAAVKSLSTPSEPPPPEPPKKKEPGYVPQSSVYRRKHGLED